MTRTQKRWIATAGSMALVIGLTPAILVLMSLVGPSTNWFISVLKLLIGVATFIVFVVAILLVYGWEETPARATDQGERSGGPG